MSKPKPVQKHKKKRRLKAWVVVVLILIILVGCVLGGLLWFKDQIAPASSVSEPTTVEVTEGMSNDQLLKMLEEKGVIKNAKAASLYLKISKPGDFYAGNFQVDSAWDLDTIMDYLSNPNNIQQTYAVVTVPEGTWAKEIAATIEREIPGVTAKQMLDLWNDPEYIKTLAADYSFLEPDKIINSDRTVLLEGYLFPETYYIDYDMSPDQITRVFLNEFAKRIGPYQSQIDASGMDVDDVVNLASVVQFESGDPAIMPDIAEVFFNRLEQDMPLQSSVTVCYALYDDFKSAKDCEVNPDIDSPYNTYLHKGLPIGPILNPGEDAIAAVLNPAENDYLFFVADIHGDGSVHFAKTLEEHEANVEKFNLNY